MTRAAIDIGSNSILLTIADRDGSVLHDEARVVGLGKGVGDRGLMAPDRISAAAEVLHDYVDTCARHGIDPIAVRAVATSAGRRAMNAPTVFDRFRRDLGLRVRIISGEEEARLTWLGAHRDLPPLPEPHLVADLGGGSTELVLGTVEAIGHRASLELGSVRLTERFLTEETDGRYAAAGFPPMEAYIDAELSRYSFKPSPQSAIGVAGTVTTLAAMQLGLEAYDASQVHGSRVPLEALHGFVEELGGLDRESRRARAAVAPSRADYLPAGALVLSRVLVAAGCDALWVSDRGLRYGVLYDPQW